MRKDERQRGGGPTTFAGAQLRLWTIVKRPFGLLTALTGVVAQRKSHRRRRRRRHRRRHCRRHTSVAVTILGVQVDK